MRIGYFGGSFDPPHRGHLAAALAAQERFALDQVWLAPTGRQPLKPEGALAGFPDRLAMTRLLCEGEPGLQASDLDAPRANGRANYTAETLQILQERLPRPAALFAIAGADAFAGLPKWRSVDQLFALAEWIVVSRPGFTFAHLEELALRPEQRARVHLLEGVHDPTSATDLRGRLRAGLPCEAYLPAAVLGYIAQHGLYGA